MLDYSKLIGKRLLILGCTMDDCQIVRTAQKLGVYVIVTDNHMDWNLAPAKLIADEAWDISWADLPKLKECALSAGVNGIMAGYDERRIKLAIELSKEIGTPFYAEDVDVLQRTFNKQLFKDICREFNVPVTKDYYQNNVDFEIWSHDVIFPVVVKPIDNGGSAGIRTSYNKDDLKEDIKYALSFSNESTVIVEELIRKAQEVVIYYTIAEGEVVLSAMCDKYERVVTDGFNSLPDAYVYPSIHMQEFIEKHNDDVVKALKSMGMRNGSANLQGFYTSDGRFVFFEMDFRPGGTNTYHFTDFFSGENYLKMMIHYSLTGEADKEELTKADPCFDHSIGCIFTLLSKDGVITKQMGKEEVDTWSNVLYSCFYHPIGKKIEVNGSQVPKTFRAYIVGKSIEDVKETITKIQSTIKVLDEKGNDMLFEPFDVGRLVSPI